MVPNNLESDRDVYSHPPSSTYFWKGSWHALEDHEGAVSTGGRAITNLHFADDINGSAGEEEELAKLAERLDKAPTAYGMEIRRSAGVRQGCLLSPTPFNIFLKRIMTDALEDHEGHCQHRRNNHQYPLCWWHRLLSRRRRKTGKISWESWQSLHSLRHGYQKSNLMTNNTSGINTEIKVNGQKSLRQSQAASIWSQL